MYSLRQQQIMTLLAKKKQMKNTQLCDLLHCSLSTLRRDLLILEDQNLLKRTHGGVLLTPQTNTEYDNRIRMVSHVKEKEYIAEIAQTFVGPGMCLFLDSSSTVLQICPYLKEIPNLLVITNGLQTALALNNGGSQDVKTFILGGEIKPHTTSVISDTYDSIFESFQFDLAIFSARSIDENGVYEASFSQAKVKKEMMKQAKNTLLLMDNSKFNTSHFFKIGNFLQYNAIITNQEPDKSYQDIAKQNDIELLW